MSKGSLRAETRAPPRGGSVIDRRPTRLADAEPARVICWFSCGDTSAVATKIALKQYAGHEIVIARIVIPADHPDNDRFAADCARWYGQPIVELRSDEYTDTWDVWTKRRYIAGIKGAPCTTYLKKAVRDAFQEPDDIQVFGFDAGEASRVAEFRARNFEINLAAPLLDRGLTKDDCHALIRAAGIEIPMMYRLGFNNNNCIGCPKGGAGYWNRIRVHFPEVFARMATLERELGAKLIKLGGKHISLDELDPSAGRQGKEPRMSCDLLCQAFSEELGEHEATVAGKARAHEGPSAAKPTMAIAAWNDRAKAEGA